MVTKILGYILSIAGLVGLASTIEPLAKFIPITVPSKIASISISVISIVLIVMGLLLIVTKSSRGTTKGKEIPIYHGKEIVGYRKH